MILPLIIFGQKETPCVSLWELHKLFWPQYVVTCLVCRSLIGFWSWFKLGNLGLSTPYSRSKVPQVFCLSHLKRRSLRFVSFEGTLFYWRTLSWMDHTFGVWFEKFLSDDIKICWHFQTLQLSNVFSLQYCMTDGFWHWNVSAQGVVQSQGLIHCYSAGSSGDLAATVRNRLAPLLPLSRNIHRLLKCSNTHSHTDDTDVK